MRLERKAGFNSLGTRGRSLQLPLDLRAPCDGCHTHTSSCRIMIIIPPFLLSLLTADPCMLPKAPSCLIASHDDHSPTTRARASNRFHVVRDHHYMAYILPPSTLSTTGTSIPPLSIQKIIMAWLRNIFGGARRYNNYHDDDNLQAPGGASGNAGVAPSRHPSSGNPSNNLQSDFTSLLSMPKEPMTIRGLFSFDRWKVSIPGWLPHAGPICFVLY